MKCEEGEHEKSIYLWRITIILVFLMLIFSSCAMEENNSPNTTISTETPSVRIANTNNTTKIESNAISWQQATNYIGKEVTISGPVVDTNFAQNSNGSPTFLNIGRSFPDSSRLTVVIWGDRRSFLNNPESFYDGKNVRVTGIIHLYEGVAQIVVSHPSQIKVD